MKKCFLLVLGFSLLSGAVFAQLNVNSQGRAIFGHRAVSTAITIEDLSGTSNNIYYPFRITRNTNDVVTLSRDNSYGMQFLPYGGVAIGYNLQANNTASYIPLTIYGSDFAGAIHVDHPGDYATAVRVRNVSSSGSSSSAYSFASSVGNASPNFYVTTDGRVFSGNSFLTSDVRLKNKIETIESPLDKVLQLRGVTYYTDLYKEDSAKQAEEKELSNEELYEVLKQRSPDITPEIIKQMKEEKSRKQMGVIAQEVEKIIPEVVRTREDGLKAVAYSEMIGLLIEAIKEQQVLIDNQNLKIAAIEGNQLRSAGATGLTSDLIAACALAQNTPNPFTEQTEIKYFVAPGAKNAFICIFDMQGKMLQKLDAQVGQNSLFIEGSKLEAGMYLYSLVVDGQEVDTKRMILTK